MLKTLKRLYTAGGEVVLLTRSPEGTGFRAVYADSYASIVAFAQQIPTGGSNADDDYFETEWVDADGLTWRVRTRNTGGEGSSMRDHIKAVLALKKQFPPKKIT